MTFLAYKASSYLEDLIKHGLVDSEANAGMDRIYEDNLTLLIDENPEAGKPRMLSREAVPRIAALFGLPSNAERDLLRALDQTELRISKDHSRS